jgi:predicted AAA+ superfamily ATPase
MKNELKFVKVLIKIMEYYITREIEANCINRLKANLVTAIVGARQVGKTTLIMRLREVVSASGLIPQERIFYYSFDDPLLRAEVSSDIKFIEKETERALGEPISGLKAPILLIIDEAQKLHKIFDWVKIVYDNYCDKIKIILSGSSTLCIKKKSAESLAGRITFLKLYPFTIRELIQNLTNISLPEPLWNCLPRERIIDFLLSRQSILYRQKNLLEKLLERILIEGSLPGVYTAKSTDEKRLRLSSMVSTYLERDIRLSGEVGSLDDYLNLLKTVSFEIGSIFNFNKLSSELGIAYNTVKKYISILQDTFILNSLPPLLWHHRKRLVKSKKMYFFDVGVANFLSKRTEKEHIQEKCGFIFENILIKSFESENENRPLPKALYFWRDYEGHEIDLVFENDFKQLVPVEIYFGKNLPKEKIRNFCAFFNEFKESQYGILIYCGDVKEEKVSGRALYLIPWWLWL